ncbi:TonB-dependent siderophore receptor [Methylobacillus methanolivorans]|uniref:TonB-dependent siderophore receptor n=1 Tax=Methylobacillus methanolivorans TaxID=1848927 RepID=A0ABW8GK34_9PROT
MAAMPFTKKKITHAILLSMALSASICAMPHLHAAEQQADTTAQQYDIPAGTLDSALGEFGRITGRMIAIDPALTIGIKSQGLQGRFTEQQGLSALLLRTGLEVVAAENGGYRLRKASQVNGINQSSTPNSSNTLPEISVHTIGEHETATGQIKGYVAKRSTSATKTDSSLLENPQSISIITRDELTVRNVQRDGDALRYTAGVISENYGNDIRPGFDIGTIRGFDPSTTGMYRDGLREFNGLWSRLSTDINTVERIEVLKGLSSVLYGQSEPAGVINKISKRPSEAPVQQVEIQAGNYNRYQGSLDMGGPLNSDSTALYRIIGMVRDSETPYKYDTGHRSQDNRELLAPSITLRPSEKTSLTLQAEYLHAKTGVSAQLGSPTTVTDIMIGDYRYDKNERKQYSIGYLFEHAFNDAWTFRQNLRSSKVDFQYARMGAESLTGTLLSRSKSYIDEQLNGVALDNHLQAKIDTGMLSHTLLLGVDFQRSAYTLSNGSAVDPADNLDLSNPIYGRHIARPAYTSVTASAIKQTGIYLQDQIKFGDHWVFTLSGRRDRADISGSDKLNGVKQDKQEDQATTYRAGVAYIFDNGVAPYASYSESFNPSAGVDGNGKTFKPTTGKQYEAGLRYMPHNSRDLYTFSVFEITQQNVVTYTNTGAFQTGEIRSRGAELEIKTQLLDNLNLVTALTYNDVKVTKTDGIGIGNKGDSPVYVPRKAASTWLDYKISTGPLSGLGIGAGVRYTGESNGGNPWGESYTNRSYTQVDAMLNYHHDSHWYFALNANNLFDKEYTVCGWGACTMGYTRSVIATARYSF